MLQKHYPLSCFLHLSLINAGKGIKLQLTKQHSEVVFTILLEITPQNLPGLAESGEINNHVLIFPT